MGAGNGESQGLGKDGIFRTHSKGDRTQVLVLLFPKEKKEGESLKLYFITIINETQGRGFNATLITIGKAKIYLYQHR